MIKISGKLLEPVTRIFSLRCLASSLIVGGILRRMWMLANVYECSLVTYYYKRLEWVINGDWSDAACKTWFQPMAVPQCCSATMLLRILSISSKAYWEHQTLQPKSDYILWRILMHINWKISSGNSHRAEFCVGFIVTLLWLYFMYWRTSSKITDPDCEAQVKTFR